MAIKALLRWLGGEDDGKVAIVDVEWIKNFDPAKWTSTPPDERDETEVVEWRVGKTPVSGFYQCFDAKIIMVSGKISYLNAEMKRLRAEEDEKEKKMESEEDKKKTAEEGKKTEVEEDKTDAGKVSKKKNGKDHKIKNQHQHGSEQARDSTDSDEDLPTASDGTTADSESEGSNSSGGDISAQPSKAKKHKLKKKADKHTFDKFEKKKKAQKKNKSDKKKSHTKTKQTRLKVPIYEGSQYYVDSVAYEHSRKISCSSFVTAMLHQLFKDSVLVVSNLRGGVSKTNATDFQRWALDKKKREAIVTAATHHFQKSRGAVHGYIVAHINSLRFNLKKRGKLARYEEKGRKIMAGKPHTLDNTSSQSSDSGEE